MQFDEMPTTDLADLNHRIEELETALMYATGALVYARMHVPATKRIPIDRALETLHANTRQMQEPPLRNLQIVVGLPA